MKKSIREKILNKRISHKRAEEDSKKITQIFMELPQLKNIKNILLYYPHKNEVNTVYLIRKLLEKGFNVFLPKVSGKDIIPVKVEDISQLKEGYAGIKEPEGEGISPEEIDIVVVPAVAFDRRGHRLGYGKGYYDRFLKKTKALKVGLAYDFQVLDRLPIEPHDIPVDIVITPAGIINTKKEEDKK